MALLGCRYNKLEKPSIDSNKHNESGHDKHTDTGVSSIKKMWNNKTEAHLQSQAKNPFREGAVETTVSGALKPGDIEYGKPPPGSLTAERAAKAADWVTQEIDKLLGVIRKIGSTRSDGKVVVKFGPLFYTYTDISDTLVGIMMRAKKRQLISYPGDYFAYFLK
jgi:hypothetical protein